MKKSYSIFILLSFLPFISYGQQSLQFSSCEMQEYAVNDYTDSDDDGILCEAKIVLSNSAFYSNNEICQLSNISWTVIVDLNADGTDDIEYSSSLPASDNDLDDTNNNGIPDLYIPMTTNNEIQNIPLIDIEGDLSNHNVSWTVSDECGLSETCATSFTVADIRAPSPFCFPLVSIIYDGSELMIYAEDYNVGSIDNCTAQDDIKISFSGDSIVSTRLVTCNDLLNSPVTLDIYFWDDSDNVDFCSVLLNIIPTSTVDCLEDEVIAGIVKDWKGNPLEGVEIILDANTIEYPNSTFTDSEGKYTFGSHEGFLNYTLSAHFDASYVSGVSTLDLVLIVRHLLGLAPFLNPYQIIASDINGDNAVKASDLFALRKLILGVISEIATNTSWKILRSDFEFDNPSNPFLDLSNSNDDPFTYEFNAVNSSGYDFIGIKIGDVNN